MPCFETAEDLTKLQLESKSSDNFLRAFTCISIDSIPCTASKVGFKKYNFETSKPKPYYSINGAKIKFLKPENYTKGNLLAKKFKNEEIGTKSEKIVSALNQNKNIQLVIPVINTFGKDDIFEGGNQLTLYDFR